MNTPVEQGERKTGSYEDKHIPGFSDQKHSYLRLGWGHNFCSNPPRFIII
jgi:hypothetical protein